MSAADSQSWMRMALESVAKPDWIESSGPDKDVVLSTRVRVMRNLAGFRFPPAFDTPDAMEVMRRILAAAADTDLIVHKSLTNAERDYLVGCRLVSPEFEWTLPGRALMLNRSRSISLMVNEEDHLRAQSITPGWSFASGQPQLQSVINALGARLDFAWSPDYGYLSASPTNLGTGLRVSGMFHLIGLAHLRRLSAVIRALVTHGLAIRGLFGENSRAIGAFVQVSSTRGHESEFLGAGTYLMEEERRARAEIPRETVSTSIDRARELVESTRSISLADAVRVVAWIRWGTLLKPQGSPLVADRTLAALGLRPAAEETEVARRRADLLRALVG